MVAINFASLHRRRLWPWICPRGCPGRTPRRIPLFSCTARSSTSWSGWSRTLRSKWPAGGPKPPQRLPPFVTNLTRLFFLKKNGPLQWMSLQKWQPRENMRWWIMCRGSDIPTSPCSVEWLVAGTIFGSTFFFFWKFRAFKDRDLGFKFSEAFRGHHFSNLEIIKVICVACFQTV